MVGSRATPNTWPHRGISLLEVLIAIGILSIGLLSALALIPAGRTYILIAEQDDRSAAAVPNALATLQTLSLFNEDSLEWQRVTQPDLDDDEQPAERPAYRQNLMIQRPPNGVVTDYAIDDLRWDTTTTNTANILTRHPIHEPPIKLSGTTFQTNGGVTAVLADATVTIKRDGTPISGGAITSGPTGEWDLETSGDFLPSPPSPAPPQPQQMEIETEGSNAGTPKASPAYFADYSFTFEYDNDPSPTVTNMVTENCTVVPDPSRPPIGRLNPYRHYWPIRATEHREGDAFMDLSVSPKDRRNEDKDQPLTLPPTTFNDVVMIGKIRMTREASAMLAGSLWRFEEGRKKSAYTANLSYSRNDGTTVTSRTNFFPTPFWTNPEGNPPGAWADGSGDVVDAAMNPVVPSLPEDRDYYRIAVEAGQGFRIEIQAFDSSGTPTLSHLDTDSLDSSPPIPKYVPVEFSRDGTNWLNLDPIPGSTPTTDTYSIPNDGFIRTGLRLAPLGLNPMIVNTIAYPGGNTTPQNDRYNLQMTSFRPDRMIAIDPLMCAHLDRTINDTVVSYGGNPLNHPLANRRRRFADFQQIFLGSSLSRRAFVIPRLNWKVIADNANFDAAVAVAERLCRFEDTLETTDRQTEGDAPEPAFDETLISGVRRAIRREAAGRMTWMLTVQPRDLGSVASNWFEGKLMDVGIVIFEDRPFPAREALAVEGEYAFEAGWSDSDGLIKVAITDQSGGPLPTDDELRQLFKAGSWLLVAPSVTYTNSLVDSNQKLDWVRVQTADYERRDESTIIVTILPEKEPVAEALLRTDPNTGSPRALYTTGPLAGRLGVMALVYEGVVDVIKRTIPVGN